MIEFYDNAKAIISACDDIDAVILMIETAEEHQEAQGACLASTRCALAFIATEIRAAADAIAEKVDASPADRNERH